MYGGIVEKEQEQDKIYGTLLQYFGETYSSILGIDLASMQADEVFKWLLASIIFGTRTRESVVINTYKELEKAGAVTGSAILITGWQGLVDILDRGGYARYDYKTATKLLMVTESIESAYKGDLNRLHFFAEDKKDLEKRIQDLGKGIRPATVYIFLRELRGIWDKAKPSPLKDTILAARNLKLNKVENLLQGLITMEEDAKYAGANLTKVEVALARLGRDHCRKKRCLYCPIRSECPTVKQ
ncbi:MAG: hypothetical protein SVY53_03900 [Chloroflexota bacterium]|nr:hypothetical protein [Chloroflexota bacterium]